MLIVHNFNPNFKYIQMKKIIFIAVGSLIIGTSCSNSKGFNINGTYNSDFGDLTLKEEQKKVSGNYKYPGPGGVEATGTLTGDLNDKTVNFTWVQKQGETKSEGSGSFNFSADAKSFTGSWTDSKGGTGAWNGTKK
jgi:hypothetical protein